MFKYKHNQRSRYQRTNQKHRLKRKCVTHKSAVTIDNNNFRFDRVDLWPMTFGHRTRMLFVTGTQCDPWISSNSNRKPHSYLSPGNSSKCGLFFYFFSLSLSVCLFQANPTGQHTLELACVNSIVQWCDSQNRRTHTHTHRHSIFFQYTFEWRRFVYFAAFTSSIVSCICEISLADRWATSIYSRSIVTGRRNLFDS